MRIASLRLLCLLILLSPLGLILSGCGGLPADSQITGGIVVFAAFEGTSSTAPRIKTTATVILNGGRYAFNGPSGQDLIVRNIPFGTEDPPKVPMTVTARGYKTVSQQLELSKTTATYVDMSMETVDLAATGTVSGVVTSTTGTPISGAVVTFHSIADSTAAELQGFTDKDGKFVVGGIPIGSAEATAEAAGYLSSTQTLTVQPDATGTNAALSYSLLSGATKVTVRGVVKELRTEEVLSGATVTIGSQPAVTTGSDGRFSVADVPVGTQTISVRLAGYDDYDSEINALPGMGDVVVTVSRISSLPPTVPYTIGGTVTLLGATDNSGAVVTAYDLDRGMQMASYTTGADGRYYLFVPAGRYEVRVTVGSHSIARNVTYLGGGRVIDGIDFALTL